MNTDFTAIRLPLSIAMLRQLDCRLGDFASRYEAIRFLIKRYVEDTPVGAPEIDKPIPITMGVVRTTEADIIKCATALALDDLDRSCCVQGIMESMKVPIEDRYSTAPVVGRILRKYQWKRVKPRGIDGVQRVRYILRTSDQLRGESSDKPIYGQGDYINTKTLTDSES